MVEAIVGMLTADKLPGYEALVAELNRLAITRLSVEAKMVWLRP
jgi:hypothetical protein